MCSLDIDESFTGLETFRSIENVPVREVLAVLAALLLDEAPEFTPLLLVQPRLSRGIVYTFVLINISFGLALLLLVTLVLITLRRWRRGARLKGFLAIPVCTLIRLGSRI